MCSAMMSYLKTMDVSNLVSWTIILSTLLIPNASLSIEETCSCNQRFVGRSLYYTLLVVNNRYISMKVSRPFEVFKIDKECWILGYQNTIILDRNE